MARIVTVYTKRDGPFSDMSFIRWYRMSAALARLGHSVDIAVGTHGRRWWPRRFPARISRRLRRVPLRAIRWSDYDVVETHYSQGFKLLEEFGGDRHPFIIGRLGTVVGPEDRSDIPFCGAHRADRFETQARIQVRSRLVSLANEEARKLWTECYGEREILIVPGGVDAEIPEDARDPYPDARLRCLFAGHLRSPKVEAESHAALVGKLNELGLRLPQDRMRLYVLGAGDTSRLDPRHVTVLGAVPYEETWKYLRHAHVGLELVRGERTMHNNESSKLYHYLRAGLPTVSERQIPNAHLVAETGLGYLVDAGDMDGLEARVQEAALKDWDRSQAIRTVLQEHTWDHRAGIYDRAIRAVLAGSAVPHA